MSTDIRRTKLYFIMAHITVYPTTTKLVMMVMMELNVLECRLT